MLYEPYVTAGAQATGLTPLLIRAFMLGESNGRNVAGPTTRHGWRAQGPMQMSPDTFAEVRARHPDLVTGDITDPAANTMAGSLYLKELRDRFGPDLELNTLAWNAGPGYAERYLRGEADMPDQTRALYGRITKHLAGGEPTAPTTSRTVALPPQTMNGASPMDASMYPPVALMPGQPAGAPAPSAPAADGAAGMFGMGGNDMWLPMLMALGSGLMQGRNLGDGLAKGGQGILPAIMAQAEWKRQQRRDQLEEQALGMKAADAQAKALQRQQMEAMIASLPPDQQAIARLDPGAFAAARAKSMFDAPSGMRMGPDGPEWLPGYIEGQQSIRAAGRPQVSVQVSGEKKGAEKLYTDAAEGFAGAQAADRAADKNAMLYNQLETALNEFKPGALAEYRLKFGKVLSDLGVPVDSALDQGELAKAIGRRLELVAAGTMKGQGQITENERLMLREALPSLTTTLEGNKQIMNMLRRLDSYDKQVAQAYRDNAKRNGGIVDPVSVAEDLAKLGPALSESDYVLLQGGKRGPAPAGLPPVDQRRVGDVYDTPRGKAKWMGNGWELQR
ncbi:MAG TPA: lytic transglycosylase domain-containing protein [Azospirillum sp.]|nr:lytic transglycosylase domain-containing protein [Azospirillum sp.]